ncbi:hypothetical protein B1C78_14415 [Thioalkalivibrio denitrificans]|uniref:Transposase IS801/IS1294 domain-containing protein n=1 Tax=Thioalkalivibrio denitrificans TaxID=108003 RepID=A0A1V3NC27_9GAMM|nr:hypothetical protein B1C78_14415 [Thioalkalivibrio denitrificans]
MPGYISLCIAPAAQLIHVNRRCPVHGSAPRYSEKRLWRIANGNIHFRLMTPYWDGTNRAMFEPSPFIIRLMALAPRPRVNLTRVHSVFARNIKQGALLVSARRGKGNKSRACPTTQDRSHAERRGSMTCAWRPKRVFDNEIGTCQQCGVAVLVIPCMEDPSLIAKILTHQGK